MIIDSLIWSEFRAPSDMESKLDSKAWINKRNYNSRECLIKDKYDKIQDKMTIIKLKSSAWYIKKTFKVNRMIYQ